MNGSTAPPTEPVASPCTSVCTLDAAGSLCVGCFRTLDEIASWSLFDADAKRAVLAALPERRARAAALPVGVTRHESATRSVKKS